MIMDAGSESASSATRVVRLISMREGRVRVDVGSCVCVFVSGRECADGEACEGPLTQSSAGYSVLDVVAAAEEKLLLGIGMGGFSLGSSK